MTGPAAEATSASTQWDAIVVGGGHNGLVCAAYLARGGLRTVLIEARATVGGTASSEVFAGATVNICNCDHLTFRATPVIEELDLSRHGLHYLDLEPALINMAWSGGPAWASHHSLEQTLAAVASSYPAEVEGYRRYAKLAMPAARLVLDAANDPPSLRGLTRKVARHRGRGLATLLRWSRRSAADVMREFFTVDALQAPGLLVGPMVWGLSPELPGTGLGALTYAMRHVTRTGRPRGGSGEVPRALLAAFVGAGGTLLSSRRVEAIVCEGTAARGVVLDGGEELQAPIVVSACNPHDTFLRWLRNPPPQAGGLVRRWQRIAQGQGYESKIDAILSAPPRLRPAVAAGVDSAVGTSYAIAPSIDDMHVAYGMIGKGAVLPRPGLIANVPSAIDATLAPKGQHVLSLEALFTPYSIPGGWASSLEPARWLELFGSLTETGAGFADTVLDWRAMTPDRYEREFHLPRGHATSFAGGPLAAIRSKDPELTRYETAVKGLYLTGAATFPGAGVWGASGRNAALTILRRVS